MRCRRGEGWAAATRHSIPWLLAENPPLWALDPDTLEKRVLVDDPELYLNAIGFTPDGTKILFRHDAGGDGIFAADPKTGEVLPWEDVPVPAATPVPSAAPPAGYAPGEVIVGWEPAAGPIPVTPRRQGALEEDRTSAPWQSAVAALQAETGLTVIDAQRGAIEVKFSLLPFFIKALVTALKGEEVAGDFLFLPVEDLADLEDQPRLPQVLLRIFLFPVGLPAGSAEQRGEDRLGRVVVLLPGSGHRRHRLFFHPAVSGYRKIAA